MPMTPEAKERMKAKLRARVYLPEWKAKVSAGKMGGKRPDVSERNRRTGPDRLGKKLNLSPAERERRRQSIPDPRKYWANISPEEAARRSEMASAQMRRVWAERKVAG